MTRALSSVVALTALALISSASAEAQSTVKYVALGDSYASGAGLGEGFEGLGPYDSAGGKCLRHRLAYPARYTEYFDYSLNSYACNGARTEHVISRPQFSGLTTAQTNHSDLKTADMLTVTIGGNDAGPAGGDGTGGLGTILRDCYSEKNCHEKREFTENLRTRLRRLSVNLNTAYNVINQRSGVDTAIFVVGYPRLFATDPNPETLKKEQDCDALDGSFITADGYTPGEQNFLNAAIDRANAISFGLAARYGFWFVDPRPEFTGHGICDEGKTDYINAIVGVKGPVPPLFGNYSSGSFHPNIHGHAALARVLYHFIEARRYGIQSGSNPIGRLNAAGLPVR